MITLCGFLTDLRDSPVITLLFLGKYAKRAIVSFGGLFHQDFSALGNVAFIIVELFILGIILGFVSGLLMGVIRFIELIRAIRGRKK